MTLNSNRIERKYEILTLRSNKVLVILSGALSLCLYVVILMLLTPQLGHPWLIYLTKTLIVSILGGILASFLLKIEYEIQEKKRDEFEHSSIILVTPFFLIITAILILHAGMPRMIKASYSLLQSFFMLVFLGVGAGSILDSIWRNSYKFWISRLSPLDWGLLLDKEDAEYMLKLRFQEVKRYGGPLSICLMSIAEYSDLVKKHGKRKINKALLIFIRFARKGIRMADYLGRIEDGQLVMCLLKTAGPSAEIPCKRLAALLNDKDLPRSVRKMDLKFNIGLVSVEPEIETYEQLEQEAKKALREAQEQKVLIVRK